MELSELVKSIDVVDFFSRYTELEQRGREFWGLTPFQDEKTPSFSVDPENNVFYCFSTGYGGDVIDFLKQYYHCSVREAINKLKDYCGEEGIAVTSSTKLPATVICKKYKTRNHGYKQSTAKVLPETCMDKYIEGSHLESWIQEGISEEILNRFQVRYDKLDNRIVYPIRNMNGEIVNIGGRTLDPDWKDKGLRKYTYYQGWGVITVIYGMFENQEEIIKSGNLILFEGAKSVMLSNTWGIWNSGAILTSHLSESQMRILLSFCTKNNVSVTFALDKEIDVMRDKHVMSLSKYINVYYLFDKEGLLPDVKMAPVDMGKEVFEKLLCQKMRL